MKLEMLRVFQTVAEKCSLAAAADSLNRTPSAVSMTLSQLTETMGASLLPMAIANIRKRRADIRLEISDVDSAIDHLIRQQKNSGKRCSVFRLPGLFSVQSDCSSSVRPEPSKVLFGPGMIRMGLFLIRIFS